MKTKWIFGIVAVIMIWSMVSISPGADRFYYGTYYKCEEDEYSEDDFCAQKDSLGFNINLGHYVNDSTIHYWRDNGLRAIVANSGEATPTSWGRNSHYTVWEAEGLEGSYFKLSYDGGTLVNDASASGGKAMCFSGPGTPGLIQWGPSYYQESELPRGTPVYYTAEFRLKYLLYTPRGSKGSDPPTPLCSLKVVDIVSHSILKDMVIYKGDFAVGGGGSYQTFKLENYTVPGGNRIEFQIYWFGIAGGLYIDYVKVYDGFGWQLIEQEGHPVAEQIKAYVSQSWVHTTIPETGDTVVYRWYLRDEPQSIDLFATNRYIDSLLRVVSTERVGFQAFNRYDKDTLEHEYFLRQDPEEYHVDLFPMRWVGQDTSGQAYQQTLDNYYIKYLSTSKNEAENRGKDFWVTIQTFVEGPEMDSGGTCSLGCSLYYEGQWYCFDVYKRLPTPNEVRFQTFLALCYGADAILNFSYESRFFSLEGEPWLRLGLYEAIAESTTAMWREIRDFTGPRVETLAPIFNQLTWQGAGFYENVDTITGSFIDSLKPAPGETLATTYVQVGFFKDDADTDYFMLVNRQCLENEDQNVTVYIDSASIGNKKMWYVIDQYSQDTTFTGAINGAIPFTTHLAPGEGKLFKLISFADSAFHGTAHPLTWQGGILVNGDVTVDSVENRASPHSSRCATIISFDQSSL
jgi:hypothetical protein